MYFFLLCSITQYSITQLLSIFHPLDCFQQNELTPSIHGNDSYFHCIMLQVDSRIQMKGSNPKVTFSFYTFEITRAQFKTISFNVSSIIMIHFYINRYINNHNGSAFTLTWYHKWEKYPSMRFADKHQIYRVKLSAWINAVIQMWIPPNHRIECFAFVYCHIAIM